MVGSGGRVLQRRITPCQFGGDPDCTQCGCMASAALEAVGKYKLPGGIRAGQIYWMSRKVGKGVERIRGRKPPSVPAPPADGVSGRV